LVATLSLRAGELSVQVTPSLGARITSLRVADTEWIAQPVAPPRAVAVGSAFVRVGLGGWDEMLPTISGSPDHGEVWAREWTIDNETDTSLTTSVELETSPLKMVRTLSVSPFELTVDYNLSVIGHRTTNLPVPTLWAAHPLLQACEIRLPLHVTGLLDVMPNGTPTESPIWVPIERAHLRLDALERGAFAKYYVPFGIPVHSATVLNSAGGTLDWSWSSEVRYLGIWMDRNAVGPGEIVALEPCTAGWDDLGRASRLGMADELYPGVDRHWQLRVRPGVA